MAALTHGADPDALRRLAEDMLNHAEYTLGVGIRTQQHLTALRWSGPDADRARQQWESVELPRIRTVSKALAEAAGSLLEHERAQREVSEQTTAVAAPSNAPVPAQAAVPVADSSSLGDRARRLVDFLVNGPEVAQVAAVVAAGGRGAVAMTRDQYALVSSLVGASKPAVGAVVRAAGAAGTALNIYDAGAGLIRGDAVQATGGIGGLLASAGGPAVGASWGLGYATGGAIYDGIQGTTYGDALQRRNDMAFDTLGAGGMLIVPGNLALAAWDVLTGSGEETDGDR